jgi:hypothetical protein
MSNIEVFNGVGSSLSPRSSRSLSRSLANVQAGSAVQIARIEAAVHGDAFRAFMQLPGVRPGDEQLLDDFERCYVGAFNDMEAIVDGLTDADRWQDELDEFANERGLERIVWLDPAALRRIVVETWDISVVNGKFYVFEK